jgi:hypothetical protein
LRQVLHGFNQQTLAVDVAGIGGSLTSPSSDPGDNWNSEDLGHEKCSMVDLPAVLERIACLSSITSLKAFFSLFVHCIGHVRSYTVPV